MTEGRYVVTSNTKLNVTLAVLVAVLLSLLASAWSVSRWVTLIESRVERLEEDKCPCGPYFQRSPPAEVDR